VEEDVDGQLEEFCRLKRLGHFKDAEEYFQSQLLGQIKNLPVAVEYAGMLLEQGAYKRIDELIQDGELTFPEELLLERYEREFVAREREREKERRRLRAAELEAERLRQQRIKEQDEEIRRRPAVPTPAPILIHARPAAIESRGQVSQGRIGGLSPVPEKVKEREKKPEARETLSKIESTTTAKDGVRGLGARSPVRGYSNRYLVVEDNSSVERLRDELLQANLRLIVASANMYSHGDFKQVLLEMKDTRSSLRRSEREGDEELGSIRVCFLCSFP
jgi:hypothetical protein